jgi:hypothetical protein
MSSRLPPRGIHSGRNLETLTNYKIKFLFFVKKTLSLDDHHTSEEKRKCLTFFSLI